VPYCTFRSSPASLLILALGLTVISSPAAWAQCTLNPQSPSVTICQPANGATVTSPVQVVAGTTDNAHPVTAMKIYIDNQVVFSINASQLNTSLNLSAGQHNLTINAWDSSGAVFKTTEFITVQGQGQGAVSVAVSPNSATLNIGQTQQFTATVLNAQNTAVTWSVDGINGGNSSVGTITAQGLYTAPSAPGTHNVVATSVQDPTKSDTAIVSVTSGGGGGSCTPQQQTGVKICLPAANATVPSPVQVQAVVTASTTPQKVLVYIDNQLVYQALNTNSINTFLNVVQGTHFLVVQAYIGTWIKTGENFTVANGQQVSVSIAPTMASVPVGATQQFTATVSGTSNTAVTWAVDGVPSGNASVGTVDANGLYTAPQTTGHHTVTATSVADTSKSASATVTVTSGSGGGSCTPSGPNNTVTICQPASGATLQSPFTVSAAANSTAPVTKMLVYLDNNLVFQTTTSSVNTQVTAAIGTHNLVVQFYNGAWIKASENITVTSGGGGGGQPGVVPVVMHKNDLGQSGVNPQETILTPSNVNVSQFGKKYSYGVDGQIYGQPLYLPNLSVNGANHNTVFAATENNSVYAFDANGGGQLWHVNLGAAVANNDPYGISPILGITSTMVIDRNAGALYVVNVTTNRAMFLHKLDVHTGRDLLTPMRISASVPGTGSGSSGGRVSLSAGCYQRVALALANGRVYLAFGHCNHGWILAYNAGSLAAMEVFNTTPNGKGGTIWMSGGGIAVDSSGNLYVESADDIDSTAANPASGSYPDAFLKLSPTLQVLDYFIPSNQGFLTANDADLGSGAPILLPNNELVGGGKDGRVFILNRSNLGHYNPGGSNNVMQTVQTGTQQFDNIWGSPAYWNRVLYFHTEADVLKAYGFNGTTITTSPIARGSQVYQVHGASPSISSNGNSNGIVWEVEDSAYSSGPAILHAYDAANVAIQLYDSTQAGSRDSAGIAAKFSVPTIADGKVFVPTSNQLNVYGLLSLP
jgi:hypothetical protein